MGNRLCKKKTGDIVDLSKTKENTFDRIITRLRLNPTSWKSESQLNKQVNRLSKPKPNTFEDTKGLSKSSDWVEASLEVPEMDCPHRNPNLALIFNQNDTGTPTPPPRKHKKGIREKIEVVAKNSLQALQRRKIAEEPLCVKKQINYDCPCDDENHKKNHLKHVELQKKNVFHQEPKNTISKDAEAIKAFKREKNLSVVSLPNYNDLKFSIANFDYSNKKSSDGKDIKSSDISLPGEAKGNNSKNYMIRCRSFGSLLPQQLFDKLKPVTQKSVAIESDDSFGPLEDWDLGLIEHYNPRDASLPRSRKQNSDNLLSNIESLVIAEKSSPNACISLGQNVVDFNRKNEEINDNCTIECSEQSSMAIPEKLSVENKNIKNFEKNKTAL